MKGEKEGRKEGRENEERRKAGIEEVGGEGNNAPVPLKTLGAPGSLGRVKNTPTSRSSPRPKKRGKGLFGQGVKGKEGTFSTLKNWLLREHEAVQEAAKDQDRLGEG